MSNNLEILSLFVDRGVDRDQGERLQTVRNSFTALTIAVNSAMDDGPHKKEAVALLQRAFYAVRTGIEAEKRAGNALSDKLELLGACASLAPTVRSRLAIALGVPDEKTRDSKK